jgi:hypothetical protein
VTLSSQRSENKTDGKSLEDLTQQDLKWRPKKQKDETDAISISSFIGTDRNSAQHGGDGRDMRFVPSRCPSQP